LLSTVAYDRGSRPDLRCKGREWEKEGDFP
jgi:hypothetical protein